MSHATPPPSASDLVARLTSPEATALLAEIAAANPTPATALSVATRLRKTHAPELVAQAMTLHDLRVHGRRKFARADQMLLTRAGLEQATSERIATWRSQRYVNSQTIVDLCCGIGGDLLALAQLADLRDLIAVDLDPDHLAMAVFNAHVHAPNVTITPVLDDVRHVDLVAHGVDAVFIDPARRNERGRFSIGVGDPPLAWAFALTAQIPKVGIKTFPGIPHEAIPGGWELETIALDHDLKEAMLWSPAFATAPRRATVITDDTVHTMTGDDTTVDPPAIITPEPGMILHDANPAVTRAGLVVTLAHDLGAALIDEQIGFLVTNDPVATPFARSLRIVASQPWNERQVKQTLRGLEAGPVDIRRRGLAGDVDQIAKRLRGTGSRAFTIAMTRHRDQPWAIICEDVTSGDAPIGA